LMRTVEASSSKTGRKKRRSNEAVSKQSGEYMPDSKSSDRRIFKE
jgi:hypothetical protein